MSEQFEHNIRKRLQDAEAPFEPMAWERMEKLLDDPRRRRPLWWWLGGLALILGLGGWWFFSGGNVDNAPAGTKTDIVSEDQRSGGTEKPGADHQRVDNEIDANGKSDETAGEPKKSPGNENQLVDKVTPADTENPDVDNPASTRLKSSAHLRLSTAKTNIDNSGVDKPASRDRKSSDGFPHSSTKTENENPVVDNAAPIPQKTSDGLQPAPIKVNTENAGVDKPAQPSPSPSAGNREHVKTQLPAAIPSNPDKKNDPGKSVVDNSATSTSALKPSVPDSTGDASRDAWKAPRRKGFEGGIFLGPDVNATGSFTGVRAGFTGGLLLRYHVNNRWFISTGAAYTKKLYGASPKEYDSPYPGNYVDIDADCDVIDVPLNLHYVFADRPSGRWNVSAGASTYFMLREKYDYYYPNNYKRTRVFSNQNQHWFSVINLSAGWEKNTKGRVNWGLQPYVKIPAGGVGEGKVKLYSAGVSLQVTMGKK